MSAKANRSSMRSMTAGVAIAENLAVVRSAAGTVALPGAANVKVYGFAYTKGDPADVKYQKLSVVTEGEADAVAAASITEGQELKVAGTSGKLTPVTGSETEHVNVVGRALEDAAADQVFAIQVLNYVEPYVAP